MGKRKPASLCSQPGTSSYRPVYVHSHPKNNVKRVCFLLYLGIYCCFILCAIFPLYLSQHTLAMQGGNYSALQLLSNTCWPFLVKLNRLHWCESTFYLGMWRLCLPVCLSLGWRFPVDTLPLSNHAGDDDQSQVWAGERNVVRVARPGTTWKERRREKEGGREKDWQLY